LARAQLHRSRLTAMEVEQLARASRSSSPELAVTAGIATAAARGARRKGGQILDDATEPSWELTAIWPLNEIQRLLGLLERHKDPSE
jgi:hypothetical protein